MHLTTLGFINLTSDSSPDLGGGVSPFPLSFSFLSCLGASGSGQSTSEPLESLSHSEHCLRDQN